MSSGSPVSLTTALDNFDSYKKTQFKNINTDTDDPELEEKINAVLKKHTTVSNNEANSVINAGFPDSIDDIFS